MTTLKTIAPCLYIIEGMEPQRGSCLFEWDSEDPLAVTMEFENADDTISIWTVGRDIFVDCLVNDPGPVFGEGDARVARGSASVNVTLIGAAGERAEVSFPSPPVFEFFRQCLHRVPRGQEESLVDSGKMDAWLEQVLTEADGV